MSALNTLVYETTNIKNELITCYTNLKNNLIEKGVECSDKDKFENLVSKINSISTGKKWAKGEAISSSDKIRFKLLTSNDDSFSTTYIIIPKLDFIPTTIIARYGQQPSCSSDRVFYKISILNSLNGFVKCDTADICSGNGASEYSHSYEVNSTVMLGNGCYRIPLHLRTSSGCTFEWIAFE
ncbi:hypothetical protein [Romboutsia hominis]|uniref:hypothetical protein n=1 Tax=Romboutsia hominis TaxID=1507512 RepID=UPI000B8792D0|nr:hypothetical protein [Romboutsia hominis]